ncbi:hypothetical protein IJT17_06385 [bacterium]|nr:hypothetical protein [bacterium]
MNLLPLKFSNSQSARDFAEQHTARVLRPIKSDRATLRLLDLPDQPIRRVICKDFFDTPRWYRRSVGRFLISHECGAYRRLQGVPGIPAIYGRPHPDMMLMQYIEGAGGQAAEDLWKYKPGELPPEVLTQMQDLLTAIHDRRVIHLDIGHDCRRNFERETNFMWDPSQQKVYLIDFAGAFYGMPIPGFIRRGFEAHDNLALVKIHDHFFPDMPYQAPEPLPNWAEKLFTKLKKI